MYCNERNCIIYPYKAGIFKVDFTINVRSRTRRTALLNPIFGTRIQHWARYISGLVEVTCINFSHGSRLRTMVLDTFPRSKTLENKKIKKNNTRVLTD